jgi:Fe-Mn family superoxide dismutase
MKHLLPPLPYDHAALEPHIDVRTMTLHHDNHHAAYVDKLNEALAKAPQFQERSALWLLLNLEALPDSIRTAVHNNAGGHVNHSQFWRVMAPPRGGAPSEPLGKAIDASFGSMEKFKKLFAEAGVKVFGSGWVWLVRTNGGETGLQIMTTAGHDNPLMQGHYPLLANDVWEHAYYLKHESRRAQYLDAWWPLVNWPEVDRRHEHAKRSAGLDFDDDEALQAWEGEGGHLAEIN